jgi:dCTP deaminase
LSALDGPWKTWIPGVLSDEQLTQLFKIGLITGLPEPEKAIGESSLDLTLTSVGYELTDGAVKPIGPDAYEWFIKSGGLAHALPESENGIYTLKSRRTYVFKLNEKLDRRLADAGIYGQATAKSSVGRLDVLARLIVDGMDSYERFTPEGLDRRCGDLYIEITPITFDVKVKKDIPLSQLRLFYGAPESAKIWGREIFKTVFQGSGSEDGTLSVDLTNVDVGGLDAAAFRARREANQDPIPLWEDPTSPKPWLYWRLAKAQSNGRLKIEDSEFYLLRSKETLSVPPGIAIYCQASDETIGEMRIHYAGFAHPYFGWKRDDGKPGTPLMFEVRGHQVNVSLADGEKMANVILYRMSEEYKLKPGKKRKYQLQTLNLSGFFGEWPVKLKPTNEDGTVEPETGS